MFLIFFNWKVCSLSLFYLSSLIVSFFLFYFLSSSTWVPASLLYLALALLLYRHYPKGIGLRNIFRKFLSENKKVINFFDGFLYFPWKWCKKISYNSLLTIALRASINMTHIIWRLWGSSNCRMRIIFIYFFFFGPFGFFFFFLDVIKFWFGE